MLPHITFSQDADTDSLVSVLAELSKFAFDFRLIDGTVLEGRFDGTIDNDFLVRIYTEGEPNGEIRRIDPDKLVEVVYL